MVGLLMSDELYDVVWKKKNRLRNLISTLDRLHNQDVRYGFFEESGSHPESPHLNYPTLAFIHEKREDGVPARPILTISSEKNKREMAKFSLNATRDFINRAALLKREAPTVLLREIGEKGVKLTKPIFGDSSLLAPNTDGVARAKGSNKPMIDYGALKEALASKESWRGTVK